MEKSNVSDLHTSIELLRHEVRYIKELNEQEVISIKSLNTAVYGDIDQLGLLGRIRLTEERLKLFWWALAAVGSSSIAVLANLITSYLSHKP